MTIPFSSKTKEEQKEEKVCVQLDKNLFEWLKEAATALGSTPDNIASFLLYRYREVCNAMIMTEIMKRELKDTKNVKQNG